ncbi:acidic repeat-containing protein [Sturnira hondurensis]|uniref:acidic repeat-containing protein n=1 Tax=Sturnira hondurensis TaxID=192404 RepID=UPI00187A8F79|nr:acidic repeat-containing protein [Sturnira hondurensis]
MELYSQLRTTSVDVKSAPERDSTPGAEGRGNPCGDQILEVTSGSRTKYVTQEMPIVISDDDDSDMEGPVIIEDSSADEDQVASMKKEMMQFTISPRNSSDTSGNPNQPLNGAEAKLEIPGEKMPTDGKVLPVVDQPRKRTCKTKHLCVPPVCSIVVLSAAVKEQKRTLEEAPQPQPKRRQTQPAKSFQKKQAESAEPPAKRKRAGPPKRKPQAVESSQASHQHEHENVNCNIPGCFLHGVEKLKEYSGRNFKKNKDELVRRLYVLFNETVFNKKLPEKLDICWNKKMLRTAGLCSFSHLSNPAKRYTKIDISLKVCDSADRIRDTLAHELCHAASWLLNGIRTSHGCTWRYYARMCNLVHPELPLVTRFHNYKINYKIYYECTGCKTRIGRYSRSLDTERYACTSCKGRLVLLPLTRKDGTPIKPHVRPFAKYVKNHYRIVRQGMKNPTHGDVMRQLSKDYFVCKKNNTL